jgi:putative FmdB family regulatory protein
MPTYGYKCTNCGKELEVSQKITEEHLKQCPSCGKDTLLRGPGGGIGLSFTGSGFYINDYGPGKKSTEGGGGCCPCGKNKGSCDS